MNPILPAMLAGLLIAPPAPSPGQLDLERVPADAAWLVHLDIEAILRSSLGRFLLEHGEELRLQFAGRFDLQRRLGIDPLTDLRSVTVFAYGPVEGPNAGEVSGTVVSLETTQRADDLPERLRTGHPGYSQHELHGQRIHSCFEGKRAVHGFLRPGANEQQRALVYSEDYDALIATLRLLEGERRSAAQAEQPTLLLKPGEGLLVYLAARTEMLAAMRHGPASLFFRHTERWALEIAEADGALRLRAAFTARDEESAENLTEVLEGVVALARMFEEERGLHAALRRFARASSVARHGREVVLETRGRSEELIGAVHAVLAAHVGLPAPLHPPSEGGNGESEGHR